MTGTDEGDGEMFTFFTYRWNVSAGWRIAAGRAPSQADISAWFPYLTLIRIDMNHVAHADLTQPLLIVRHPSAGPVVIDGWHRLARARIEGQTQLPIVVLTEDEERQIRIYGGDKGAPPR